MLLTGIVPHEAGSGGWVPSGPVLAMSGGLAAHANTRPERVFGWTSHDGRAWLRHRVTGLSDGHGNVYVDVGWPGRGRQLGTTIRDGGYVVVGSADALHWKRIAPAPQGYDWGGSEGLLETSDAIVLFSDDDRPDAAGFGNALGGWRSGSDATWNLVLARQPGFTIHQAVEGDIVIVVGQSWDPADQEWSWTLVSTDGARTWDPELSWTGAPGTRLGDVAIHAGVAVMLGCPDGESPICVAAVPSVSSP